MTVRVGDRVLLTSDRWGALQNEVTEVTEIVENFVAGAGVGSGTVRLGNLPREDSSLPFIGWVDAENPDSPWAVVPVVQNMRSREEVEARIANLEIEALDYEDRPPHYRGIRQEIATLRWVLEAD